MHDERWQAFRDSDVWLSLCGLTPEQRRDYRVTTENKGRLADHIERKLWFPMHMSLVLREAVEAAGDMVRVGPFVGAINCVDKALAKAKASGDVK